MAAMVGTAVSCSPSRTPPQGRDELGVLDAGQIGAGTEMARGALQHDDSGAVGLGAAQRLLEPGQRLVIQSVSALGPIDDDGRDRSADVVVDHRPVQRGARFSAKAAMPSAVSSVAEVIVSAACNRRSASSAG